MSTADPQQPGTSGEPGRSGGRVPGAEPGSPATPGSGPGSPATPGSGPEQPAPSRWRFADGVPPVWLRRLTVAAGVLVVLVLLGVVGSIVLPGWWAGIVTGWVQGISSAGILAGLACGLVFTVIPASVIWLAVRSSWTWRTRLIVAAAGAVVALPNVLTLVIDVSTTASAEQARLDMVIGAPSFTGSTLIGAIVGVAGVVGGVLGWRWLRRSRAELRTARDAAGKQAPGTAGKQGRSLFRRRRGETDTTSSRSPDAQDRGVQ